MKYSKTKLPWFSCLLQHSARKRKGGLILQRPRAHTGRAAGEGVNVLSRRLRAYRQQPQYGGSSSSSSRCERPSVGRRAGEAAVHAAAAAAAKHGHNFRDTTTTTTTTSLTDGRTGALTGRSIDQLATYSTTAAAIVAAVTTATRRLRFALRHYSKYRFVFNYSQAR